MRLLQYLTEKQIVINNGKKYGQIVFLAGGAGSGKGHAIKYYMESDKFKVIDVDEWKRELLKLNKQKQLYPELNNLDLRNPNDVYTLHHFIKEKHIKCKVLDLLFSDKSVDRLPNIIFDITMKDHDEVEYYLPQLIELGYKPTDIHVVWVLTDYTLALDRNKVRDRVVPDDIMLKTHSGVPVTMIDLMRGKFNNIDGSIIVIFNDPKFEVYYTDDVGNPIFNSKESKVLKDFKYITLKKPGKNINTDGQTKEDILSIMKGYIPKTKETKDIFHLDTNSLY